MSTPAIYGALLGVMADIATIGIAKLSKNKDQGYHFRGIEAAMNELSPLLIRHKIVVVSTYAERHENERETKSGGKSKFVAVKGTFRFVHAEDGSFVEAVCWGEAFDSADKATTKAQSVAFRTALFQTFVVPTQATAIDPEGDGDDGAAADDAGAALARLLDGHTRELRLATTDADALGYWNTHKAEFSEFPQAYAEFKNAAVAHRRTLQAKAKQTEGAPA